MRNDEFLRKLGIRLRAERKKAGLSQDVLAKSLGHAGAAGHSYVSKLEQGRFGDVGFLMLTRYLQVCKVPVGKFMLELAQSGAFGEAEQGMIIVEDKAKVQQAKREKARILYQKRWEREFRDAQAIEALWKQVLPAIKPMFPTDRYYSPLPYLNGLREYYRVWKKVMRQAKGSDPTQMLSFAFDQLEKKGVEARLIPAIVRKVREMASARLSQAGQEHR